MKKSFYIRLRIRTVIFLIMGVLGLFTALSWPGKMIDLMVYDVLMVTRPARPQPHDIVIVAVDEPSFKVLKHQWPWPRSLHSDLILSLFESGASIVALDILFSEPSTSEEDFLLSKAINERTVLAAGLESIEKPGYQTRIRVQPVQPFLERAGGVGVDILPLESDGFLRKGISESDGQNAFAFEAASVFRAVNGKSRIEKMESNLMGINFSGPPGTIPTVSYYQALDPSRTLPEGFFRDKLVFVGFSLRNAAHPTDRRPDHYPTPFVRFGYSHMAGVEIQANITLNFLQGGFIKTAPLFILMAGSALLGLGAGIVSYHKTPVRSGLMVGAGLPCLAGVSYFSFSGFNLFIPVSILLFPCLYIWLSALFLNYYRLVREKQYIRQVFSRYVSRDLVRLLLKHPEKLKLGGEFAEGTVLFLDIRNFTGLTRKLEAEELIRTLSRYLGRFTDIILENHGMIDKIAGDAIMAVWGVPLARPDHACLACRTALTIEKTCEALAKEDEASDRLPLSIRIGVNSGTLLAGNIGGRYFSDFTVHGVDVNLANRLETMNKKYGTTILIGENTRKLLSEPFNIRPVGTVSEKDEAVAVYELKSN